MEVASPRAMRKTSLLLSLSLVVACTDAGPPETSVETEESLLACLPYPVEWPPAPGAQARAQAKLDELAMQAGSTPTMQWSQPRGTWSAIWGIYYPLSGCPGSVTGTLVDPKVEDALWALF